MTRHVVAIAMAALCVACGERAKEMRASADALQAIAKSADRMQESANEAERFVAERRAAGDTLAMPYKDLQAFLPGAIGGYTADGTPTGQTMNMGGFSMSTAEQRYVSGGEEDQQRIHVTITDYSGSESGYMMMAPLMALNMSMEDDQRRAGSAQVDIPYTYAYQEYEKQSMDAKATVGTRYRYFISVEASGQKDDMSEMVLEIASDIARRLADK